MFASPWTVAHQAPLSMGILQARVLECIAMPSSRGSSKPRDWTQVSHTAGRSFTVWTSREAQQLIGPEKQASLPLSVRTCSQPWPWGLRGYLQRLPTQGDGCFKAGWLQYPPSSSLLVRTLMEDHALRLVLGHFCHLFFKSYQSHHSDYYTFNFINICLLKSSYCSFFLWSYCSFISLLIFHYSFL